MKKINLTKNIIIEIGKFRSQNKHLPLPHKLFKPGIRTYKDKEGNKFFAIVVKNFRIMIVKNNK